MELGRLRGVVIHLGDAMPAKEIVINGTVVDVRKNLEGFSSSLGGDRARSKWGCGLMRYVSIKQMSKNAICRSNKCGISINKLPPCMPG